MLQNSDIPELVDRVDPSKLRVYAPTPLLFVCGGQLDVTSVDPISLRDAFLRFCEREPFDSFRILVAEELNAFFPRGKYTDILKFENDLAQICDIIILFSESYGSAAELGAFSMSEDISSRLLVIIDDNNYSQSSFITLGPLRLLENSYGETAICVVTLNELSISSIKNVHGLNSEALQQQLETAVHHRMNSYHEHTTFDRNRDGHIVKLIVGLLQHYGALTIDEIDVHLSVLQVDRGVDDISNYLLCAEFAGWVVRSKVGIFTYFVAIAEKQALSYEFREKSLFIDKLRWKTDILLFWENNDANRHQAIRSTRKGEV